jgi:predicted MFS family arabinose efflux permease
VFGGSSGSQKASLASLNGFLDSSAAVGLSVYRFWRDLGYAVGALAAGIIADAFGLTWAIGSVGALTFVSGAVVAVSMHEKRPKPP